MNNSRARYLSRFMLLSLGAICACSSTDSRWLVTPEKQSGQSSPTSLIKTTAVEYEIRASARFGARTAVGPCLLPIFSRNTHYFERQIVRMEFRISPLKPGGRIYLRKADLNIRDDDGAIHKPTYINAFRVDRRPTQSSTFSNWDRNAAAFRFNEPVRLSLEYRSAMYGKMIWFSFKPRFSLNEKEIRGRLLKFKPTIVRKYNLFQFPFAMRAGPR